MKLWRIAFLLMVSALLFSGCSQPEERRHPLFQQGRKARAEGDGAAAKAAFEKLLMRRPESTAALLELAGVCDELLDDPFMAAYYYQRYLAAVPDSPDAEAIRRWQENAEKRVFEEWKKRFADKADVAETAPMPQAATPDAASAEEVAELRKKMELYQTRYNAIREEVVRLRQAQNITVGAATPAEPEKNALPEFYVVKAGDNPGKIAQKLYGDSRKHTLLMRANPGVTAKNLKPGMKLVVPAP